MSACTQQAAHPLVKGKIKGLQDFPHDFKLPAYMPFDVKKTPLYSINTVKESGRTDGHYSVEISFKGSDDDEWIVVGVMPEIALENSTGEGEKQIQLSDGTEAEYYYNGATQIVTWNDGGQNYLITVYLRDHDQEEYSQEELINIADSLEPYYFSKAG